MTPALATVPHRRYNPLTGNWVLVSPHRTERPWQGQHEATAPEQRPAYDPSCYLCPGNRRAGNAQNPAYSSTFVFENDFAALLPSTHGIEQRDPLFSAESVPGECRVVCFSPRHDLTLADMNVEDITRVIDVWAAQTVELGARYRWVQVFENKGAVMGCSNPHPHGQIWAVDALPNEAAAELRQQERYRLEHSHSLLIDYAARERTLAERVVLDHEHWLVVVPFWAVWPFETLLLAKRPVARLDELQAPERASLAHTLKQLLMRYDRLFETSFPYSMGFHQAPFDGRSTDCFQLHAHFYPPLLRSATVKKFMVGYELLAEAQRDLTPERAAERLRALSGH